MIKGESTLGQVREQSEKDCHVLQKSMYAGMRNSYA